MTRPVFRIVIRAVRQRWADIAAAASPRSIPETWVT